MVCRNRSSGRLFLRRHGAKAPPGLERSAGAPRRCHRRQAVASIEAATLDGSKALPAGWHDVERSADTHRRRVVTLPTSSTERVRQRRRGVEGPRSVPNPIRLTRAVVARGRRRTRRRSIRVRDWTISTPTCTPSRVRVPRRRPTKGIFDRPWNRRPACRSTGRTRARTVATSSPRYPARTRRKPGTVRRRASRRGKDSRRSRTDWPSASDSSHALASSTGFAAIVFH